MQHIVILYIVSTFETWIFVETMRKENDCTNKEIPETLHQQYSRQFSNNITYFSVVQPKYIDIERNRSSRFNSELYKC